MTAMVARCVNSQTVRRLVMRQLTMAASRPAPFASRDHKVESACSKKIQLLKEPISIARSLPDLEMGSSRHSLAQVRAPFRPRTGVHVPTACAAACLAFGAFLRTIFCKNDFRSSSAPMCPGNHTGGDRGHSTFV